MRDARLDRLGISEEQAESPDQANVRIRESEKTYPLPQPPLLDSAGGSWL